MLPLSLDLARLRVVLLGNGTACVSRLHWLEEAGAAELAVYAAAPSPALAAAAGERLRRYWPQSEELRGAHLIFIADIAEPERSTVAASAREAGAILHVEDDHALTDCHAPAILRRGALTIAISTEGAAPGAAAEIKRYLAASIGPEWRARIERLRTLRQRWRLAGADVATVRRLTAAQIGRYGWRKDRHPTAANDRGIRPEAEKGGGSS